MPKKMTAVPPRSASTASAFSLTSSALAASILCFSHVAFAQVAAEPAKPKPIAAKPVAATTPAPESETPVASVTVSGERPTNRIDRQVYDVKSDVASTNGTAADALNNVPSVAVDPDGTVSLRGSTKVQILIDGKPSAMLQGENRGAALQAMASDDIESVEVINNPGAQFGNEAGGGPILNLVMRRTRRPGGFALVNANGGTAGRYNTSMSGSYNQGRLGFQGGINYRHDGRNSEGNATRDRMVPGSDPVHSFQSFSSVGLNDSAGLNAALNYNLGSKDTLGANMSYAAHSNDQVSEDHYQTFGQGGDVVNDYLRTSLRNGDSRNYSWGGRFDHKGEVPGEILKVDLRVSSARNASDSRYANDYALSSTGAVDSRSVQDYKTANRIVDFTGDYERPGDIGVVKLGYKVSNNQSEFDTRYFDIDPATLAQRVNVSRTNAFNLDESNVALYGSMQWRLNETWGMLAGLRAEYTHIDLQQITSATEATNHYISAIPSFFATYKVSDTTNLRFSYAHRIRRANASELNPFVVYRDELNVSSGNPQLKPTQTDSFELGFESKAGALEANVRAYYRRDKDAILYRRYFINDTVLLTTPENGGGSRAGGLEFTLSGKVTPKFSINTSGNLAYAEQTLFDITGLEAKRTGTSLSLRGRFNYQATPQDHLQLALNAQGRTLAGQGYRAPSASANFSFRHMLTPALSMVLNVTDVFNTTKIGTTIDTDALKESSIRRYDGRIAYLGLSYRFGGFTSPAPGNPRPAG